VEHPGGVVYDGIRAGEQSASHVNDIRKQLVDGLQKVKPGTIRWPGGCFADACDWRAGTGPRDKRPARTNFWREAQEWAVGDGTVFAFPPAPVTRLTFEPSPNIQGRF
jgi:alpha-N-arabinofuranosidase